MDSYSAGSEVKFKTKIKGGEVRFPKDIILKIQKTNVTVPLFPAGK